MRAHIWPPIGPLDGPLTALRGVLKLVLGELAAAGELGKQRGLLRVSGAGPAHWLLTRAGSAPADVGSSTGSTSGSRWGSGSLGCSGRATGGYAPGHDDES